MPTTVQLFYVAASNVGQTLTFTQRMGTVMVINSGAANVFVAPGGAPPLASIGPGRKILLPNGSLNFNNADLLQVSFRCAPATTTDVEVVAQQAQGGGRFE